jgi:Uma2 family endonuclease
MATETTKTIGFSGSSAAAGSTRPGGGGAGPARGLGASAAPSARLDSMLHVVDDAYHFDPADPRSPSQEQWDRMSAVERARVLAMLPAEVPWELQPPEGDPHWDAKATTRTDLKDFFGRTGRRIYISSELAVFYPNEPRFSPDILAVVDVELRPRTKWAVVAEGKGLDLVIEVYFAGDKSKDYELNVERYARLGIAEYFIFDRGQLNLRGYRLPAASAGRGTKPRAYQPILPQGGLYASQVLGLELRVEGERLRFYAGTAAVLDATERIEKLALTLDDVVARKEEAERLALAEAARADDAEAAKATAEAGRADEAARADAAEQRLAEALAEIERLKRER